MTSPSIQAPPSQPTECLNQPPAGASVSTSAASQRYLDFLISKIPKAELSGFEPPSPAHPSLFPHQVDIVTWACRGGRRAGFCSFGLGKSRMALQLAWWVAEHTGGKFLIICPLGVRLEFLENDGPAMGYPVHFVKTNEEVQAISGRIFLTNYESVRDGKIDVNQFAGASLDEASVLRSFGSKTYQTFLGLFKAVPYRYVFTATPSPNRYKELIHYAGFLGIMDTGEALTRFFQRDSEQAGNLTLYPHMEATFWLWLHSWAVFIQKPSDLGHSDEGYDLPKLHVHWHKVDVDHTAAWSQVDSWGQQQLLADRAQGLSESAAVKRQSIHLRLDKAIEIMEAESGRASAPLASTEALVGQAPRLPQSSPQPVPQQRDVSTSAAPQQARNGPPQQSWLLWHDLEAERLEIERRLPHFTTVYGTQDLDAREEAILAFSRGHLQYLATKPIIAGAGCNFQRHCSRAIFLGAGYKFYELIQAVHRLHRFQQTQEVHIHIIFLESEASIIEELQRKWREHDALVARMCFLLRKHRLSPNAPMELVRKLGCERLEVRSSTFTAVHNDSVLELQSMPDQSMDMWLTSIPFGNQYEYSPSFNDFGHNPDNTKFFEQMHFLVPEILRTLKPGRICAVHVKDRIRFGNVTGLAVPTVDRFSDKTADIFEQHGFVMLARITIDTDVVRENAQTYRLGWSENAKDSSKMGAGMPEYVLVFRRLQSDLSNAYADEPVTKDKETYTRADWQLDAAGFWRSNGNRLLDPEYLRHQPDDAIKALWIQHSLTHGYSHEEHVTLCKALEGMGKLPSSFMLFPAVSRHKDIWTDIVRMRTLNSEQSKKGKENHLCPLQLDVIERLITRYTNPGERVGDMFGGIGSVPYQAIRMGRKAWSCELNPQYWHDSVGYAEMAEREHASPTLFDLMKLDTPKAAAA